jgi:hypothetical protein
MGKALYLNKTDARDIRNLDELLSGPHGRTFIPNADMYRDMWAFFRGLRVRLDKAGDTTKPWQDVKPRKSRGVSPRIRKQKSPQ